VGGSQANVDGYRILVEYFKYTVSGKRTCEFRGLGTLGLHSQLSIYDCLLHAKGFLLQYINFIT